MPVNSIAAALMNSGVRCRIPIAKARSWRAAAPMLFNSSAGRREHLCAAAGETVRSSSDAPDPGAIQKK
jgi:hypothetical protein